MLMLILLILMLLLLLLLLKSWKLGPRSTVQARSVVETGSRFQVSGCLVARRVSLFHPQHPGAGGGVRCARNVTPVQPFHLAHSSNSTYLDLPKNTSTYSILRTSNLTSSLHSWVDGWMRKLISRACHSNSFTIE
jgi:hypothetical protein